MLIPRSPQKTRLNISWSQAIFLTQDRLKVGRLATTCDKKYFLAEYLPGIALDKCIGFEYLRVELKSYFNGACTRYAWQHARPIIFTWKQTTKVWTSPKTLAFISGPVTYTGLFHLLRQGELNSGNGESSLHVPTILAEIFIWKKSAFFE